MIKDYKDIQITPELIRKAGECTTAEQLIMLGKGNDIEITPDEAEEIISSFNRELTDDELDVVAGGKCIIDCEGRQK